MAKGYRNQMTPGLKKCIDYMKGNKTKKETSPFTDRQVPNGKPPREVALHNKDLKKLPDGTWVHGG